MFVVAVGFHEDLRKASGRDKNRMMCVLGVGGGRGRPQDATSRPLDLGGAEGMMDACEDEREREPGVRCTGSRSSGSCLIKDDGPKTNEADSG